MVDITHKNTTLREATAQAIVRLSPLSIQAIKNKTVPKGDVLEQARVAGLFAIKNTPHVIPNCHPLPIEFTDIEFQLEQDKIHISVIAKTIYKTGVEVEAMHGASVVALTIYDMVKPIDKDIEIMTIRLAQKKGGKSDLYKTPPTPLGIAVVVCSDSISAGKKQDAAGKAIIQKLEGYGQKAADYVVIPDEKDHIQAHIQKLKAQGRKLIIITGGTGLSERDVTPEAVIPLIDRRVQGIEEAIRAYGQQRTPYAMLSRSVVGFIGDTLVMALPGSTRGAQQSMDAVFPSIFHIFDVLEHFNHGGA